MHKLFLTSVSLFFAAFAIFAEMPILPPPEVSSVALPTPAIEKADKTAKPLKPVKNTSAIPKHLSLEEAIALALRFNPNVQTAELQRILDKFALFVVLHDNYGIVWQPLTVNNLFNNGKPQWNAGAGAGYTSPIGTNLSVQTTNNLAADTTSNFLGSNTVTITQPLLKGFGLAYNRIAYDNAQANEKVAKLNFKNSVMSVVINVIVNYRALVQAYENLALSKESLVSQSQSVAQTKLQVQVGQMAPSDLIQQQANLESTRLSVVQQENALRDAYQAFLTSIGLAPSANVVIDQTITITNPPNTLPSREKCIEIALKNNIPYQTSLLNLENTKRALLTAQNNRKWTLNVTSQTIFGSQSTPTGVAPANPHQPPNIGMSLSIPIDDVDNQQAVMNAKIALQNAELMLKQQKYNLVRQVIDQWQTIQNQYQQIHISQVAVDMQRKTLDNTKLQLKYGRSTVFEVNTLENSLLQQQFSLVGTEISYLNAVTALNQTLGLTLEKRHVMLRY